MSDKTLEIENKDDVKTEEPKNKLRERLEPIIEKYKETAQIFPETNTITHNVQYNDKVTEESLTEHVEFVRDTLVASSIATAEIAYEKAEETKDSRYWTGSVDLPGFSNQMLVHPSESFHNPETEKDEVEYGHHDLLSTFHLGEEHTTVMNELYELDKSRYAKLFSSDESE